MDCFSLGLSIDVMAMGITLGEGGTGLGSFGKQVEKHVDPQRRISPFFHETSGLCWMSQGLPRMIVCQDIYSITRLEVFRTTFIEALVGLQVSSNAQTGTVRIILKNDLLSSRER